MNLRVVPHRTFAGASADAFLQLAGEFTRPAVGLATGNSPRPMYDELRQRVYSGKSELSAVRPFAIDEWGASPEHECSNHAFFGLYWAPIPGVAPVAEFRPLATELSVECARFAVALEHAGGLDLVVLGLGMNGHLAFNEPGSKADSVARVVPLAPETRTSATACWGDDPPSYGLTLGLRELLGARCVLLLVNGRHKAGITASALEGPVGPDCPASYLQQHPALTVILDDAAARLLHGP